jgi:Holliday junction resolvase RusA-like endonuclease
VIRFVIEQKLPTLNEYTLACRGNKYPGAKFKKDTETTIGWYIIKARLPKVKKAVTIHFEWHEKTKKRDADNIASAKKFILDALVRQGVLIDDSRRYVTGFTDTIVDDDKDFVVVSIE